MSAFKQLLRRTSPNLFGCLALIASSMVKLPTKSARSNSFGTGSLPHLGMQRNNRLVARYYLAWTDPESAVGFMHLIPSMNTLAMRPIWYLEDLYVEPSVRRSGIAAALLRYAEEFARNTGAERLTLATAHDNIVAQALYGKLGYMREEHFWYFHRLLE